ncbi:hypothetical protein AV530_003316 [Patagioenas fasciata monilis]|uniref:Uncharacterized protein n=1 Tax=Patagioenas fasciata monilis TaxID=372326 RepID=A0A1V4K279_PATFA|nr:hypothetical protein AV530_003316 [Patagioenas fasciata monilis]
MTVSSIDFSQISAHRSKVQIKSLLRAIQAPRRCDEWAHTAPLFTAPPNSEIVHRNKTYLWDLSYAVILKFMFSEYLQRKRCMASSICIRRDIQKVIFLSL